MLEDIHTTQCWDEIKTLSSSGKSGNPSIENVTNMLDSEAASYEYLPRI